MTIQNKFKFYVGAAYAFGFPTYGDLVVQKNSVNLFTALFMLLTFPANVAISLSLAVATSHNLVTELAILFFSFLTVITIVVAVLITQLLHYRKLLVTYWEGETIRQKQLREGLNWIFYHNLPGVYGENATVPTDEDEKQAASIRLHHRKYRWVTGMNVAVIKYLVTLGIRYREDPRLFCALEDMLQVGDKIDDAELVLQNLIAVNPHLQGVTATQVAEMIPAIEFNDWMSAYGAWPLARIIQKL